MVAIETIAVKSIEEIFKMIGAFIKSVAEAINNFITNPNISGLLGGLEASEIGGVLIYLAVAILVIIVVLAAISFIISFLKGLTRRISKLMGRGPQKEGKQHSTIMFIDMKGFSSDVEKDEEIALKKLWKYEDIMKEIIRRQGGRVVKTMGDAILGDFNSAVSAVRCATTIQSILTHDHFRVRIGIHTGEVVHKAGDVYGGRVNIASRLQSIAEPGAIYVSEEVYNQVKDVIDAGFEDLGYKQLKNIENPVRVYKLLWAKTYF